MHRFLPIQFALLLSGLLAHAQGTFLYDQQSASNRDPGAGFSIQLNQPMGQSFTPSLSSVGFVQFEFDDIHVGNNTGATVYVNLRAGSISGPIVSSTSPVFMPDGFSIGVTNFFFPSPVAVTPGQMYYFQAVTLPGSDDRWTMDGAARFVYPGGTAYFLGNPDPTINLWFREGIVTPEPSSAALVLLAGNIFVRCRLTRFKNRSIA